MTKTLLLVKMALINLFSNNRFASANKKKRGYLFSVLLVPAGAMLYISVVYALLLINALPNESRFIMPVLMNIMTFMVLVMLTFLNAGGHLFGFKDFDLLMSLPVKKSSIMIAKLIAFLLMEYLFSFFLMAPYIVIYGIKMSQGFLYYLIGIIGFLLMPILPMVFSTMIALLVNSATGNFRFKNLFRNIFYLLLFGLIMFGSMQMQQLLFMDLFSATSLLSNLKNYLPILYYFSKALLDKNLFDLLIYIVSNVVIFTVFIVIFNKLFIRINLNAHQGYKVKNYKLKTTRSGSRFNAYLNLQISRYFGSTMYLINTIVGPMMLIVFMVIGAISGIDEIKIYLAMFEAQGLLLPILSAAILFSSSICMITASSISLEGKNIALLRSYPLTVETIFMAKIILQVIVTMAVNIVALFVGVILFEISFINAFILFVVAFISTFLYAVFGLLINLLFPKMEWDSETIVVKQSMAVFITMFGSMIFAGFHVLGYLFMIKYLSFIWIVMIFMVLDILITYFMWLYLINGGKKRFANL
ncbi:MAG: hypothetical protein PHG99_02710 [Erysipelotrichaceae bacterium]|nr:hypothetical protein [Erysipelotrichaceae bacterium]